MHTTRFPMAWFAHPTPLYCPHSRLPGAVPGAGKAHREADCLPRLRAGSG